MAEEAQESTASAPAQMTVISQYVRDLKFENIAAANGVNPSGKPSINVQVNVDANPIAENRFLVALKTGVSASAEEKDVFKVHLDYVGAFQVQNVPDNALRPVLLIECPRLLFPFARRIIAEVSRDGGYPPLMLDPIDFTALYRRQLAQAASAKQNNGEST
ncbi:MAG: protein-export chaperone SecB [Rhodobacteraceae bacterium]|nr:protein-export chaperone SecB [Paracoccaceae bacterium]